MIPADLTPLRATPGPLPPAGTPTVARIALPPGRPITAASIGGDGVWATDEAVRSRGDLIPRLQAAFPVTGLWPMALEDRPHDDDWPRGWPSLEAGPEPRSAEEFLHHEWDMNVGPGSEYQDEWDVAFRPWPGLRTPTTPGTRAQLKDRAVRQLLDQPGRLVLVPTPRPEDVFLVLGPMAYNGRPGPRETTAVLRSWGDRYGVLPVGFSFDTMALVVRRPPRSPAEAHGAGVELKAFCSDMFTNYETKDDVTTFMTDATTWEFWWD
ncbi:DUF4253 domain-containing protein [Mobilicoccus pelagius]|uniref:DUF4253 domain-containing protein n=1 Tax=Mobilicoccus pelagius NBRC 104925 TaxID=1089455 RepID=H5UTA5_9MICO|nr:DUF4253 domain-containing protein [Mobilicoccus pelagius]GAB48963.1 hypothetical protein MOPEL_091_00080 [Mobilicoccus pelagius NBRC 104925]